MFLRRLSSKQDHTSIAGGMKGLLPLLFLCNSLFALPISPQAHVSYALGKAPGIDNDYANAGGSIPFKLCERYYGLLDGEFYYLNRSAEYSWGNAVTAQCGTRYITKHYSSVYAIDAYYDGRRAFHRTFNQSGFAIARFGRQWDLYGNFFYPIGKRCKRLIFDETVYDGGYFLDEALEVWMLRGYQFGFSRKVLLNRYLLFKPSFSGYRLQNNQRIWGYQFLFLVQYRNLASVNISISNDAEFGSRVQGVLRLSFSLFNNDQLYNFLSSAVNNPIERFKMVLLRQFDWYHWNW